MGQEDENTSLFLRYFNVDNQFIVVFSLDIDRFQLYLQSK